MLDPSMNFQILVELEDEGTSKTWLMMEPPKILFELPKSLLMLEPPKTWKILHLSNIWLIAEPQNTWLMLESLKTWLMAEGHRPG